MSKPDLSTFNLEADRWNVHGLIDPNVRCTFCSYISYPYLGGPNIINKGGYYERTYTGLPSHDIVYYDIKVTIIDRWNPTDSFSIALDGRTIFANLNPGQYESSFKLNLCGDATYKDMHIEFIGRIFHTGPTLTVRVTSNLDSFPLNGAFGLRALNFVLGWKKIGEIESGCGTLPTTETFTDSYICPCDIGEYQASGGGCSLCDNKCRTCYGLPTNECFAYKPRYSFDGTQMINCASNCNRCTGPNANQCAACASAFVTNWDNTCVASCSWPFIEENVGYRRCVTPCQAQDKFMLWDGSSCSATCDPPLTQSVAGYAKLCHHSCTSTTEYLRWDGICVPTCDSPAQEVIMAGKKLCQITQCPSPDQFVLWDSSCSASCDPPLTQVVIDSAKICQYKCTAASEYLRWDGACVTTCDSPAKENLIAGKKLCQHPCENPSYFIYLSDNSCKPSCKYPFKVVNKSDIQYCILDISEEDAKQAEQAAEISAAAGDATNLGGTIIAMLTYNNPGLLLMGSMTEMLQYIQYLGIDYPPKLYLMLQEQDVNVGGFNTITEIPKEVEEAIPNHPLPSEFEKNDTHSSFVANSWEFLVSICLILVLICLTLALTAFTKKYTRINFTLNKLLGSLKWNLFLGIFCSSYGFSGMFTAIEFRTVNMGSILSILSFIVSLIINVIGFFVLFLIVQVSISIQTIKKTKLSPQEEENQIEELEKKWSDYEVLFEDYKNDHPSQKMYLFIFIVRTYLHYGVLGYLNDSPLLQTIFFTLLSVMMITYLAIRRPMKSKLNFLQQIICEFAIFIVNLSVLTFAIMEKWGVGTNETKEKIGDVVVAINLGLSFVSLLFLGIEMIKKVKEAWDYLKSWYQGNKRIKTQRLARMYGTKGLKIMHPRQLKTSRPKGNDLEVSEMRIIHEISQDQIQDQH